jgi:hypothetical protein
MMSTLFCAFSFPDAEEEETRFNGAKTFRQLDVSPTRTKLYSSSRK